MNEERFEKWNDNSCKVKDNQEDTFLNWEDVVKKLNEQQDTIGEQKIAIDELITDYKKLEKENEQLRKELDNFRPVMFQDMRKGTVILYSKKFGNNDEVFDEKDAIIQRLALENENLRKQVKSSETISDATSNYNAHLESKITTLEKENEQLQKELQRFKKYVFSQDNILCYKCEHCIKKDIYVVDCEMKGKVDVHGLCSLFREVKV